MRWAVAPRITGFFQGSRRSDSECLTCSGGMKREAAVEKPVSLAINVLRFQSMANALNAGSGRGSIHGIRGCAMVTIAAKKWGEHGAEFGAESSRGASAGEDT